MPHLHVGTGECVVTEGTAPDGSTYARVDRADDRVMVAASLLAVADEAQLPHITVTRPGPDRQGSVHIHTPVGTVSYRLDTFCALCMAWEASRA